MSATRLRVDDIVPLALQLESRESAGRWPQAFVYDSANVLIATRDLDHVAGGLYTHNGYTMPLGHPLLRVRYEIFTDAAHSPTALSETDRPSNAAFVLEDSAEPGDEMALGADAVTSAVLADSAVAEIQNGLSTFDATATPVELLDASGSVGTSAAELVVDVEAKLGADHGSGYWDAIAASLSAQEVRNAMKLAPTGAAPIAGSIDQHLDDIISTGSTGPWTTGAAAPSAATVADAVLDEVLLEHDAIGSVGQALTWIRRGKWSKLRQRSGDPGKLDVYTDDCSAVLITLDLHDEDGNAVVKTVGVPAQNDGIAWPPT